MTNSPTRLQGGRVWLWAGVTLVATGCWPTGYLRTGAPLTLAAGAPRTACERERWLLVAPAQGSGYIRSPFRGWETITASGHALYGQDETAVEGVGAGPLALTDVLPHAVEEGWLAAQMAPNAPARRLQHASWWTLGAGAVLLFVAGPIVLGANADTERGLSLGEGIGVALVTLGLLTPLVAWIVHPSDADMARATLRERLIDPRDAHASAALASVDAENVRTRARCATAPAGPR
jgi:hypothetical protein